MPLQQKERMVGSGKLVNSQTLIHDTGISIELKGTVDKMNRNYVSHLSRMYDLLN